MITRLLVVALICVLPVSVLAKGKDTLREFNPDSIQVAVDRNEQELDEYTDEVFGVVEQGPQFQGGYNALMTWLYKNQIYPSDALKNGIQGRVMVSFIVEKDGTITNPKIIRSVDPLLDREAIRLILSMPRWIPGKQNGKPVRVRYSLPVTFRPQ